ncbi:riboflavin kinase / FMN adenylyltransferase [Desulfotomaculum arcticum]|uniref:Riboflavin biosynthesis protein n=1 Tax=Desulfotruncus arcticus DSM 17038 TaxID=1121424 RepID=A0A1I2SCN0_9FIRM|nr:bifunctional riboflavin kinase/FAD synthetase [Desulfotruncus arcticus]SFG49479.1 riboflavin kinase / FMN adenylyltransferase [Desulfotomaculum arcticum] [Desulfotruncus arcticus DSM 17038]
MQVYNSWLELKDRYDKLVLGLGNFDGLHLGHQKLISSLVQKARTIGGTPAVFTFVPHPMAVLRPEEAPPLILSPEIKQKMIADLGVEVLIMIPFNIEFSRMGPEDFITMVLHQHLGVHSVFVGYNYTFGYRGMGTPELLKEYGEKLGFEVEVISPVVYKNKPVSSTLIRALIAEGDIAGARELLGYCPIIDGVVVYGEQRGNTLGFPTANLQPGSDYIVPPNGVYSVKVKVNNDLFLGVANIGVKPTFHNNSINRTIEVHLLDYNGNLYGRRIMVYFIRRMRAEKRFNSAGELIAQIQKDISEARRDASGQV